MPRCCTRCVGPRSDNIARVGWATTARNGPFVQHLVESFVCGAGQTVRPGGTGPTLERVTGSRIARRHPTCFRRHILSYGLAVMRSESQRVGRQVSLWCLVAKPINLASALYIIFALLLPSSCHFMSRVLRLRFCLTITANSSAADFEAGAQCANQSSLACRFPSACLGRCQLFERGTPAAYRFVGFRSVSRFALIRTILRRRADPRRPRFPSHDGGDGRPLGCSFAEPKVAGTLAGGRLVGALTIAERSATSRHPCASLPSVVSPACGNHRSTFGP